MKKSQLSAFRINILILSVLFVIISVIWILQFNRYHVLNYQEQIQLFRWDYQYFCNYMLKPGGLADYAGSFLTQFYIYPLTGAFILSLLTLSVFSLFRRTCGKARLFILPFIPSVLLLTASVNMHFQLSYIIGLVVCLSFFLLYTRLKLPVRFAGGFLCFVFVYLIAGGNALLLSVLILLFEAFEQRTTGKYIYLLLFAAWSFMVPYLFRYFIYTIPLREAYFALTPGNFLFPNFLNISVWLSIPLLYLAGKIFVSRSGFLDRVSPWKVMVPESALIIILLIVGIVKETDQKAEIISHMAYGVEYEDWQAVLESGKSYPSTNRLVCYFTNIALCESGVMPYQMFRYKQVGVTGLFLDWQQKYFSLLYTGDVYYRLGIIPEAEHCAFEALVSSPKEPNAQALKRLVKTNLFRQDTIAFNKYTGLFAQSFTYRNWAKQQQAYFAAYSDDTTFRVPGSPVPSQFPDFFMNYEYPDFTLTHLLRADPGHQKAFEYLMAYYLLQKDIERVKICFDEYFKNYPYKDIPTHYEEALMVYENSTREGKDFYRQYPVSMKTIDRFEQYAQAFKASRNNKNGIEQMRKQFGDTYWYYVHFVEPTSLQKQNEINRY